MSLFSRREACPFLSPIKIGTFLISALVAGNVFARPAGQLDSLIAVALKNSPEIGAARFQSMAAQAQIGPATQLPDPQFKISAMNVPTDLSFTSDMMTMAPQFTLMQMFPWFGKLSAAGDVQRYSYESSTDRLSAVTLDVITQLKKVYGQIYSVEKSILYMESKEQLLQGVVKVAEQLFAVGQVPQQDVFRATAELTMVRSNIIEMRSKLAGLESNLGTLLGENGSGSVRVDSLPLPGLPSLAALEARLWQDNPRLRQIHNIELASRAKTELARKAAIPDISVGVSYGYRGALMANGMKASNMIGVQVGVSLPVFFGSKQQKEIDEADFMNKAAEEQYGTVRLALSGKLRSAFAVALGKEQLIPLYSKELIPQYEATYNSSLSSYSVGKTSFAMLINNLATLINAKIELVKIESAYFSASAEISELVGENAVAYGGAK